MFSGYISDCGRVAAIEKSTDGMRWCIESTYQKLERGESICVDGVCLTVTDHESGSFWCDLSPETLACTRAADLAVGNNVNLERSLSLSDRLHGHIVMGHVDQTCQVDVKETHSDYVSYRFSGVNAASRHLLVSKGSIAINGVSLTLNQVDDNGFEVMLIPETLAKTNLSNLVVGEKVNIEYDYFAKLVAEQTKHYFEAKR